VVPGPGRHRMPGALPPLAFESLPYGDHPSSPHPRIPGPSWTPPYDDYPSWPASGGPGPDRPPPAIEAGRPGRGPRPVVHQQPGRYAPSPSAPPAGPSTRGQTWAAHLVQAHDAPATRIREDAARTRQIQVVLTESSVSHREASTGQMTHAPGLFQVPDYRPARPSGPTPIEDAVRLANRILADADAQAAAIRQEASARAEETRGAAEQEAARIREQAAAEAHATRAAAEQEAARIRADASAHAEQTRAAAEQASVELRQVAAYVRQNVTALTRPRPRS
jgi:hypothetical protein